MFGEFSQTGWFVIPGRLGDGREVDLAVAMPVSRGLRGRGERPRVRRLRNTTPG